MSTPAATLTSRGYFLGGEFRSPGEPLEVRSPYDGSLVATTCWTPEPEIEEAIRQAGAAFREIAGMPTLRRVEILRRMADLAVARREEIALTLALEAGKPLKVARMEADRTVFTFRNSADEAQNIAHEFLALDAHPAGKGRWGIVRRFPIGPIYAITPFNFPSNLVAHKLGPALAAGNPMVLKPSPKTPMSGLLIAEIACDAGVPAGVLNAICCSNERAEQLAADERFRMLTFTGSAAVGWRLKSRAGKKRVALELGGNAGCVIGADANLDFAAERCATGGFSFAGQSCISVQRIFAHRLVYDRFTAALVDRARALRTGNPLDEATDVGPLITAESTARVEAWVTEAVSAGAKLLCGGKREGNVYHPTVLTNTRPEMRVNCQEVFGPVVTVEPFDDFEKVLGVVNDSPFGLQAGVFTRDLKAAFRAYEQLEVGGVIINDIPTFRVDQMPYGGAKDSGFGREGARYAIEEMTERKLLVLSLDM